MLQELRKYSRSWVSGIFFVGVALSFVAWGIGDIFRGGSDTAIATVGHTEVSYDQLARDYRNLIRQESQRAGIQITPEKARAMGLGDSALQQAISGKVLDNIANELGLTVTDAEVAAKVKAIGAFNGPLGTFDHATFQSLISERGYTEASFLEVVRNDTMRGQIAAATENGFLIPPGYARALFAYASEMRAAEYFVLTPESVGAIAAPDDTTVAAYVKAHPDRFSTSEYRDVTYAQLGPGDVMDQLHVTDDQIKQQYELLKTNPASGFEVAEKRDIEQINFPDEASAKAAGAKFDGGATFEAVAKSYGKVPDNLGSVAESDLGSRGVAAFALPEGGVTAPQKNLSGWVLMHVTKIVPGVSKSFDDVKDQIKKDLLDRLAADKLSDVSNAFTDAASSGDNLPEAAKKSGMHVVHIAAIDANGLAPDGSKTAAAADPDLLAQIFRADVGEDGDSFQAKSGYIYAVKVDGVTPPQLKPLAAVRAEAAASWIAEQRVLRMKSKARALSARTADENSFAATARSLGLSVQSSPALTRPNPQVPPAVALFSAQLLQDLFSAPYGATVSGPTSDGNGYVIARVTGIAHFVPPPGDPRLLQGVEGLSRDMAQDIVTSLTSAGQKQQGVKINRQLFDRVIGGEGS